MRVAFDIDDTLWEVRRKLTPKGDRYDQVPDYDLIQVVRWFHKNGDEVFFWSAGGIDYCQTVVNKLGLDDLGTVIEKSEDSSWKHDINLCFDDMMTGLAQVNVVVRRKDVA